MTSRFVSDPVRREDLLALYAFEAELAAIPGRVTQPLLAEMRFTWWSDQLDGVMAGEPRKGHPVLEGLSAAVVRQGLGREPLEALIEAHIRLAHGEPADPEALSVDPMRLAVQILGGTGQEPAIAPAARAALAARKGDAAQASACRREANAVLKGFPAAAFPALLPAVLRQPAQPGLADRLRLILAVATGRL